MESFVPKSLLKDVSSVSKRKMSFVPGNKITGFSKGNQPKERGLSFLYDPQVPENTDKIPEREIVDPATVLTAESPELDMTNLKLVSVKKVLLVQYLKIGWR